MRPATKQWLFLAFLAVSLAAMVALAAWHIARARREAPERNRPAAPAGRASRV
ncbi:MAG: hypothetical protein IMZ66_07770 [Planctomycetes bacterium]|nr:hypothetical protein [Planctomycetota bacterium]